MRLYARTKRNGSRVWWASWTEGKRTIRRSTGCSSKSAAEIVVARWERERADPVYAAAQSATFGAEANRFLTGCEGAVARGKMAAGTLSMYRQKAGTLCRVLEEHGPLRLADIGPGTFQGFLDTRRAEFLEDRGKSISESELYKMWVTFRQILKGAWRAQRFGRDPSSLKPDHFGPEYEPRKTILTKEQIAELLGELGTHRGQPVAFALMTGARRAEVFAAEAGDVDIERWRVRIRGTKTEASARTIPIPMPMTTLWMWVPPGPPFAKWPNARRDIIAACKRAGVPEVTWNDLRRTFASLLVQAGVPPHIVAKLLGHKTTAMVDKVYGRQTVESLETLLEASLREPSVNQRPLKKTVRRKAKRKTKRGKT
jgi:site-specific recombinase XerD